MENRQENVPIENNNNVCCSMNEDDSLDGYDDNGNGQYAAELPPEVRMLCCVGPLPTAWISLDIL